MKKNEILVAALGGLIAAAGLYLLWNRNRYHGDKPPAKAPQLELDNPGEQSEFPSAPHEERDLG
ncbi:hypothetical protein [Flavisolibacter nicotianae]|uniref:hypothetical protein n=1 Tax=Flavisolibacter nicotianae TaxID=2364882 RepID=UPI000EAF8FA4|nr:hypothetical protein [Flavisolibacter nicotianae]